MPFTEGLELD